MSRPVSLAAMRDLLAAALALGLSAGLTTAEEPPHAEEHEHANELALFLGGTRESDETHFTIGGEYERRLGERFGLSLVVEHVSGNGAWVVLAPLSFRPARHLGLKLYAAPGFENKVPESSDHAPEGHESARDSEEGGRKSFFVARGGVGWTIELGRASLTPQLELDFVREDHQWEKALVFGIAIGLGF